MQIRAEALSKLLATGDKEGISHTLCDAADRIYDEYGIEAVPRALRVVVSVETFYGEVTNGGLVQFLSGGHGAFAVFAVEALTEVGLPIPARVLSSVLDLFPREIKDSKEPDYFEYLDTIEEKFGEDHIDEVIEQEFWTWYHDGNRGEIKNLLHRWIIKHEQDFTKQV